MKKRMKITIKGLALFFILLSALLSCCIENEVPNQPGIKVKPTDKLLTTESGGVDRFTVVLKTKPSAKVTIGLNCNDITEATLSVTSLVFTSDKWNKPQMVIITGVDDAVADGNTVCYINTAPAVSTDPEYNGIDADDVMFTNVDNDSPGITFWNW
jgi:hypothetical protein